MLSGTVLTCCLIDLIRPAGSVDIVVPSPPHLRYQSADFVALIHFNMGTFAHNGDPCCDASNWDVHAPYAAGKTRDPATFNPRKLNTSQWMESITGLGASIAVLTAKHGCGFCLWPTNATLPGGSPYGYAVGARGAVIGHDVVGQFVESAKAAGVGYGFYYSIMKSFYLCRSFSGANSCMETVLPGQHNLTDDEYKRVAVQHVTELWTQYGDLARIWVDSGLDGLGDLMSKLQPQAANTPMSPVRWCGTESGHPSRDVGPGDVWNTAGHASGPFGSPNGTQWVPKFCDPQLFQDHVWFWEPNLKVRTLEMMIPIYHDIVGRGMVMELAFSINRDGLVEESHAAVYKQLGNWVRQCYGSPLTMTSGRGLHFSLKLKEGQLFDRFQLQEDIVWGQRVRSFAIESRAGRVAWMTLASGGAIGMKRILLLRQNVTVAADTEIRLRIIHAVAEPVLKFFGAFATCPGGSADRVNAVSLLPI